MKHEQPKILGNAKIPDSDAVNWINTLREAGLSDKAIDEMMTRMNKTWRIQKGEKYVEEEMEKIRTIISSEGKFLTPEQEEYLKKSIQERE